MTTEEIVQLIDNDGLGYSIEFGLDAGEIDDPDLADKWDQASKLICEIRGILPDDLDDDGY